MISVFPVGSNDTLLWGLTAHERLSRIAKVQGLAIADDDADADVLVNLAYAWDPSWLRLVAQRPDHVVTLGGVPVLAHVADQEERQRVIAAMETGEKVPLPEYREGLGVGRSPVGGDLSGDTPTPDPSLYSGRGDSRLTLVPYEESEGLTNSELRKRERPFMGRLEPETVRPLERASYFGAYKGVTDILTKYLWPEWALVLTRIAARFGITPNMVTALGAILCVAATLLFYHGWYWTGLAAGLVFMVLDTVDGKLARCTITSSWWGNVFDHGIDLVHPPFWWYAWGAGLAAYGRPLSDAVFWAAMVVIVGGYVLQRVIEGAFIRKFGMHIHVWERFDSRFRLVTARRNPNMVILFVSLIAGRPDWGLIAVAAWTLISLGVHLARLIQAMGVKARGRPITSWLG